MRKTTALPSAAEALPGRAGPIPTATTHFVNGRKLQPPYPAGLERAVFGLGCFWGAERKFWELGDGIYATAVGYAGGHTPNPTYEEVCSGRTGHTEAVLVVFDPKRISYEQLLKNLLVLESIPAWSSNRIKRLVKSPKRYLVDPAFLGALLRLDVQAVMRDGNLLGRLLDTFVTAQLRAELDVCECRPRLHHLRDEHGRREIDLIAELGGGRILAIEIKASAAPGPCHVSPSTSEQPRHPAWSKANQHGIGPEEDWRPSRLGADE